MEYTRAFLVGALLLVAFMLWNAWQNDYPPTPQTTSAQTQQASSVPPIATSNTADSGATPPAVAATTPSANVAKTSSNGQLVEVHTDVLDVAIDTLGGNVVKANLLAYPQQQNDAQSPPFQMFNTSADNFYVAQSGLLGKGGPDSQEGQAIYSADQTHYQLDPQQKQLIVDLVWKGDNGVTVHKIFTFDRGDYTIKVDYQIDNSSSQPWTGKIYTQLQRKKITEKRSLFNIASYSGGAVSTPDKPYKKVGYDPLNDEQTSTSANWVAMLQHYFLSAWVPVSGEKFKAYSSSGDNDVYTLGMIGPQFTVAPGTQVKNGVKLYVGPESMDRLKQVAPNLDLTIDYGMLWFISIAIFWLLKNIYSYIGNWGWSIVLVTVLIKVAFYHLSAKSYRSMAGMRKLQPKMQALRERYGDDRQKMTQATMELYKTEKVSPVGGCLPMIVQIPVFIALYWVLIESVELRQAPFILWIHDLSMKDPFYVLPILMGLTMFIQQKLNPPPPDPTQAKVMMFMPVMFTALFMNFPAGLVLYWLVNNTLSILQQWWIMRRYGDKT